MSGAARYRFTRAQRLLKADEFSSVFSLRNAVSNVHFQVLARPNALPQARLGLVVGKRTDNRAVVRNYIKRTIRETFRLHAQSLAGLDLVVRSRQAFGRKERVAVREELQDLFARIRRRCPV
jgi:ribonuclease P protein component